MENKLWAATGLDIINYGFKVFMVFSLHFQIVYVFNSIRIILHLSVNRVVRKKKIKMWSLCARCLYGTYTAATAAAAAAAAAQMTARVVLQYYELYNIILKRFFFILYSSHSLFAVLRACQPRGHCWRISYLFVYSYTVIIL